MLYYSLNGKSPVADFRNATINGQAPDKGLYFPERIPQLPKGFLNVLLNLSREEIAYKVMAPYVGNSIPKNVLENMVAQTVSFPFPLISVTNTISTLELFHGPTLAFKDVGARFMSRCLSYFLNESQKKVTVLVATSGDTGGAVADGFYNAAGVNVVILYPSGKISAIQELQLTTLGKNITALEVLGNFDDCQQMVKKAFADEQLQKELKLTSANSINVARWLPQQFYYFFAQQQWKDETESPVISVPSGNFGNICAGLISHLSGLPVQHFIAACNANNAVPRFLQSGTYEPQKAVPTLSNAMDVGDPSNFTRILQMFQHNIPALKTKFSAYSITDKETKETMQNVYNSFQYTTDPHGAVAFAALNKYLLDYPGRKGYFLETAHPIKFFDIVENVLQHTLEVPPAIETLKSKKKQSVMIPVKYETLKDFLLQMD